MIISSSFVSSRVTFTVNMSVLMLQGLRRHIFQRNVEKQKYAKVFATNWSHHEMCTNINTSQGGVFLLSCSLFNSQPPDPASQRHSLRHTHTPLYPSENKAKECASGLQMFRGMDKEGRLRGVSLVLLCGAFLCGAGNVLHQWGSSSLACKHARMFTCAPY